MNIAIVGVNGLVGEKIRYLLEKRKFPINRFIPVGSDRSIGKKHIFHNISRNIINMEVFIDKFLYDDMIIFFATSNDISKKYIPIIQKKNKKIWIIDNSSEFRLHLDVPLIIPEINIDNITQNTRLISNPNCSTAQLVMVLYPLHILYKIKRVIVSTYQSVSGAGYGGELQLMSERKNSFSKDLPNSNNEDMIFKRQIDMNCIAECGDIDSRTNYTTEEIKLEKETRKILDYDIKVSATAVRVPVMGGHSESVNIEFENNFDIDDVINTLKNTKGITLKKLACPLDVRLEENIWVSRIRKDYSRDNCLNLWIVADNLMKGAALNAIQIAEFLVINNKLGLNL